MVHLVHADDHLLDTHGLGKESVLTGLTVLGETGLELTFVGGDHEDGGVSLGGAGDHVLDEITMARGVNDGEDALVGLELPEGNIDGDTTLTLGLELVEHPGVFERAFAGFSGLLLELLNGSLVNTTALVDKMSSGGGLAGVDMTDDDEIDAILFFSHGN